MNYLYYLRIEITRLFHSKTTQLIMLLTVMAPLAGYSLYQPAGNTTTASLVLANPVLAGGFCGAFLFAALTIYEFNRAKKNKIEILTDSIVSPIIMSVSKLISIIIVSLITFIITMICYLPYTVVSLSNQFSMNEYIHSYTVLMFPTLVMGILLSAALYQIFRRVDLSFTCFLVLALISTSKWCSDLYLLRWINPLIPIYSSNFGNVFFLRIAQYSRLVWLILLSGTYIFSLILIRSYGKGIISSAFFNMRKIYLPILAFTLIGCSGWLYITEPYIDNAPIVKADNRDASGDVQSYTVGADNDVNENLALHERYVDLKVDVSKGTLDAVANYKLNNISGEIQDCVMVIHPGYSLQRVIVNGEEISFTDLNNDYYIANKDVLVTLPPAQLIDMEVHFGGSIKVPNSSRGFLFPVSQITSEYVELGGRTLMPSLQTVRGENYQLSAKITLPSNMELVAQGTVPQVSNNTDGTKTWQFNGVKMFAGDYVSLKIDDVGFPVFFYYSKKHQHEFDDLNIEKVLQETMDYCSKNYGSLPYTENVPFNILMSSAHFRGGGAIGNISFMTESSFTKDSLTDSLKGAEASEVIVHEIVHQWWGMHRWVMDMQNRDWTAEALTVYTTYRIFKEKYGEVYAQKYYIDVWKDTVKNLNDNFYMRYPEYLSLLPDKYRSNLQSSIRNAHIYCKAPLQVLKAEKLIGGEEKMDEILRELFQNGGTEIPPLVTWNDFLNACGLTEEQLILKGGEKFA